MSLPIDTDPLDQLVIDPITVPVEAPIRVPVEAPIRVPVEAPITVPVEAPTAVPITVPTTKSKAKAKFLKKANPLAPKNLQKIEKSKLDITSRLYRLTTSEEKAIFYKNRLALISEQETILGEAKKNLRDVINEFKLKTKSLSDVIRANEDVRIEDKNLTDLAKKPRLNINYEGLLERDLNFDLYRIRKTPQDVGSVEYNSFPVESFFIQASSDRPIVQEEASLPNPRAVIRLDESESENPLRGGTIRQYSGKQIGAIIAMHKARH